MGDWYDFWVRAETRVGQGPASSIATILAQNSGNNYYLLYEYLWDFGYEFSSLDLILLPDKSVCQKTKNKKDGRLYLHFKVIKIVTVKGTADLFCISSIGSYRLLVFFFNT